MYQIMNADGQSTSKDTSAEENKQEESSESNTTKAGIPSVSSEKEEENEVKPAENQMLEGLENNGDASLHIENTTLASVISLLPDIDSLRKRLEDNPSDIKAWTKLLKFVDEENDLLAAREAYDDFLSRFPCVGHWKNYADFEKRNGTTDDCEKIFRRGLTHVPLSVELWIHYLNFVKAVHENDEDYVRAQFDSAIDACGIHFRSDSIWELYIQWEKEGENLRNVLAVYDQVIAMPTRLYHSHFQNMKNFIKLHPPAEILDEEEYLELKESLGKTRADDPEGEAAEIREKLIEKRTVSHKYNETQTSIRWPFEETIKNSQFHLKPFKGRQLKVWMEYLDFEIEKGMPKRILILFERCLLACALHEDCWLMLIKYLKSQNEVDVDKLRRVFVTACTVYHQTKASINLLWAGFEESHGYFGKSAEILINLTKLLPDSIRICYRHIQLERRQGNFEKCCQLYEYYISGSSNKANAAHLTIKYAGFLSKILGDIAKAVKMLQDAIHFDESTRSRVIMALVNLAVEQRPVDSKLVISTYDEVLKSEISIDEKITFAHRKIEFLEDYGSDIKGVEKAQDELQSLVRLLPEKEPFCDIQPPFCEEGNISSPNDCSYNQYDQQPQYANQYSIWNYQQIPHYQYDLPEWSTYPGYNCG